jgi:hypothetical protein
MDEDYRIELALCWASRMIDDGASSEGIEEGLGKIRAMRLSALEALVDSTP